METTQVTGSEAAAVETVPSVEAAVEAAPSTEAQPAVEAVTTPEIDLDTPYLSPEEEQYIGQFQVREDKPQDNLANQLQEEIRAMQRTIQDLSKRKEEPVMDMDDDDNRFSEYSKKVAELELKIKNKEEQEQAAREYQQYEQIEKVNQSIMSNFLEKKMYPALKMFGVDENTHPFVAENVREGLLSKVVYALQTYEEKYLGGRQAPPTHVKEICDQVWKTYVSNIPKNTYQSKSTSAIDQKITTQGTDNDLKSMELNKELAQIQEKVNAIASKPKNQQYMHQADIRKYMARTAHIRDEQAKLQKR